MGVPRFFRWVSERYPLIRRDVGTGDGTPVIDNLYLDLNGVIHTSARADDDERPVMSEEDIILNAFKSIDDLIRIISPEKMVFMAVDGVAPRAKMNQQRSRRFRSAKERLEEAQKSEDLLKKDNYFDSNCITPGTRFMAKFTESLKYFVERKLKDDVRWSNLEVIVSGPDTHGEGEHKIMDYIRSMRTADKFGGNTRHCIYGLDADLIMLSLVTHEPHFIILREKVDFSKGFKKVTLPAKAAPKSAPSTEFELLSIGVLREYIEEEFAALGLPFFDLERIIDDLVVLFFIVGNDFLPSLPAVDISEGGLDMLIRMYKFLLPSLGGYINDRGNIDFDRLERIFMEIGKIEGDILVRRNENKKKKGRGKRAVAIEDLWMEDIPEYDGSKFGGKSQKIGANGGAMKDERKDEESDSSDLLPDVALIDIVNSSAPEASSDVHLVMRKKYYENKLEITLDDEESMFKLKKYFVEAMVWTLRYYYWGCNSWRWYYPYHYSPMVVDLRDLKLCAAHISFDTGAPFSPMQQLMAVLPPISSWALPAPFRRLMLEHDSALAKYYPTDFPVDMDGKKNAWEGIVLLPFVDEEELISAMNKVKPEELTEEERSRNSAGIAQAYVKHKYLSAKDEKRVVKSPIPKVLPSFPTGAERRDWVIPCEMKPFESRIPDNFVPPKTHNKELGRWPTLESIAFFGHVSPIAVNVFGFPSKYSSFVLHIGYEDMGEPQPFLPFENVETAVQLGLSPGAKVLVDYPFQAEAKVVGIMDKSTVLRIAGEEGSKTIIREPQRSDRFLDQKMKFASIAMEKKAMRLLDSNVIAVVNMVETMDSMSGEALTYKVDPKFVPAEMLLPFSPHKPITGLEDFEVGQKVISLDKGDFHGRLGVIESIDFEDLGKENRSALVNFGMPSVAAKEIEFSHRIVDAEKKTTWHSVLNVATALKLWPPLVSHLFGNVRVWTSDARKAVTDIGLGLKSARFRCCKPGFARRVPPAKMANVVSGVVYEYSDQAKKLLQEYKEKFGDVLATIETLMRATDSDQDSSVYNIVQALSGPSKMAEIGTAKLASVASWLAGKESTRLPLLPVDCLVITKQSVTKLESFTKKMHVREEKLAQEARANDSDFYEAEETTETMRIKLDMLDNGRTIVRSNLPPILLLGDRVVNRTSTGAVPYGARGTIIAIRKGDKEPTVDVVYDEAFIGGETLQSRCSDGHGKTQLTSTLLTVRPKKWTKADDLTHDPEVTDETTAGANEEESSFRPVPAAETAQPGSGSSDPSPMMSSSKEKFAGTRDGRNAVPPKSSGRPAKKLPDSTTLRASNSTTSRQLPDSGQYMSDQLETSPQPERVVEQFLMNISSLSEANDDASAADETSTDPAMTNATGHAPPVSKSGKQKGSTEGSKASSAGSGKIANSNSKSKRKTDANGKNNKEATMATNKASKDPVQFWEAIQPPRRNRSRRNKTNQSAPESNDSKAKKSVRNTKDSSSAGAKSEV